MDLAELSTHLDRHLRPGVPKYVSLRDAFASAIASGRLQPGDKVPNEQELAAALPMSLGTIQRALRELAQTGVVDRRPGQGSFVKGQLADGEMAHPFHCRFIADDGKNYLPVFPEILSRNLRPAKGDWQVILKVTAGVEIVRRIRIANEFYVYTEFFVSAERLPAFAAMSIEELCNLNFKDLIFRATGQAISTIDLRTKQGVPNRAICKTLCVPAGTVCSSIRATGFFSKSDPVYYQRIFIPPTERELHIMADTRSNSFM